MAWRARARFRPSRIFPSCRRIGSRSPCFAIEALSVSNSAPSMSGKRLASGCISTRTRSVECTFALVGLVSSSRSHHGRARPVRGARVLAGAEPAKGVIGFPPHGDTAWPPSSPAAARTATRRWPSFSLRPRGQPSTRRSTSSPGSRSRAPARRQAELNQPVCRPAPLPRSGQTTHHPQAVQRDLSVSWACRLRPTVSP